MRSAREYDALFRERAREWRHGTGRDAAHVRVMAAAGREEEQRPGRVVHRSHDRDVRQMRAARRGIVGDEDVAGAELGVRGDDRPHRLAHRTEVHGDVGSVGDQTAVGVEHGAREVEPFADVGAERGATQHLPHLLGDRHVQVAHDLEQHGVDALGRSAKCSGLAWPLLLGELEHQHAVRVQVEREARLDDQRCRWPRAPEAGRRAARPARALRG